MKVKAIITAVTFFAVLFCFALAPAIAGKITVYNADAKHSYHIRYERWTFGVKSEDVFCVKPQTGDKHDDVIYAIGKINVFKGDKECKWLGGDPVKEYTVSGAFLPHRTFSVDITKDGKIDITEP